MSVEVQLLETHIREIEAHQAQITMFQDNIDASHTEEHARMDRAWVQLQLAWEFNQEVLRQHRLCH